MTSNTTDKSHCKKKGSDIICPTSMNDNFLIHRHSFIKGELLDAYLLNGWYRYGSHIFTISTFSEGEKVYDVHWLRYSVDHISLNNEQIKLLEKSTSFYISVKPFVLSQEIEDLHDLYFDSIDFMTTRTIRDLLDVDEEPVFDTYVAEIRDSGLLIAAGIFDAGRESIAGIKNIYHPAYKKYSLGKMLMLIKYKFCCQTGIKWYYPGYFAPGYEKFDYKLSLDPKATEVFIPEKKEWIPYAEFKNQRYKI
jgi:arginine-tRNA-protein transferase